MKTYAGRFLPDNDVPWILSEFIPSEPVFTARRLDARGPTTMAEIARRHSIYVGGDAGGRVNSILVDAGFIRARADLSSPVSEREWTASLERLNNSVEAGYLKAALAQRETTLFRGPDGRLERLSAAQFKEKFGVVYTPALRKAARLPPRLGEELRRMTVLQRRLSAEYPEEARRRLGESIAAKVSAGKFYELDDTEKRRLYGRKIAAGYRAPVSIAKVSEEVGYGVFAERELAPGQMVAEYAGILRATRPRGKGRDSGNAYLFTYHPTLKRYVIDAKDKGNIARFINHSAEPNVIPIDVFYRGAWRILLIAAKPIPPGTQLLMDYGEDYWTFRDAPVELDR